MSTQLQIRANGVNIDISKNDFLNHAGADENSTVLVCGTLVSGIGNVQSDFDIHVFCEQRPLITKEHFSKHDWICDDEGKWVEETTFTEGQRLKSTWDFWDKLETSIDIKFWTYSEIEELCAEYKTKCDAAKLNLGFMRKTDFLQYGIGDGTAFAKIFSGICIQNEERFKALTRIFELEDYCYLAYRYHVPLYDDFRDIVGAWRSNDLEAAVVFARIYFELTCWSFSHVFGDPNTNRKWISSMTKYWNAPYLEFGEDFRKIYFSRVDTDDAKKRFITEAITWSDKAFSLLITEMKKRPKYHNLDDMEVFLKQKILHGGGKSTELQSKVEWDWYKRLFSNDFVPGVDLL